MKASIVLVCVCVLGLSSAHANKTAVGILSVQTSGVSKTVAGQFELELEESLGEGGFRLIDRETLRERLVDSDYVEGCTFGPCLSEVRAATGVPLVLVAHIEKVGSSFNLVITLIDTKTGMYTSQVAQPCEVCTIDEAVKTATLATIALIKGVGGAEVSEFSSSAVATTDLSSYHKSKLVRRTLTRTGLIFLGAGIVASGLAAYLWKSDNDTGALIGSSAGGAFITSGATMLLLSRRF